MKSAFVFPVSKENAFFLDGFLTTRHFYPPHFIKLPNVIMLCADISSLSKPSNQLEKEEKKKKKTNLVRELTGGIVRQLETKA